MWGRVGLWGGYGVRWMRVYWGGVCIWKCVYDDVGLRARVGLVGPGWSSCGG